MKYLVNLLAVAIVVVLVLDTCKASLKDDVDIALSDEDFVRKTADCLVGKQSTKCSKFGEKVKVVMREITKTGRCRSCSKDEQDKAYMTILRTKVLHPTVYDELLYHYMGPNGVPKEVPAPLRSIAGDKPSKAAAASAQANRPKKN